MGVLLVALLPWHAEWFDEELTSTEVDKMVVLVVFRTEESIVLHERACPQLLLRSLLSLSVSGMVLVSL